MLVLFSRGTMLQFLRDDLPLPRRVARLEVVLQRLIENRQPHRILLLNRHVRQRRRDGGGVIVLAPGLASRCSTEPNPIDSLASTMQIRCRLVSSRYCLR